MKISTTYIEESPQQITITREPDRGLPWAVIGLLFLAGVAIMCSLVGGGL